MSILLSGYYPEGIVFAADKNATITYVRRSGQKRHVEPTATKVLSWPHRKAVVGFVGLGILVGLKLDEWMRIFIAGNRDFDSLDTIAEHMQQAIQEDFNREYPEDTDLSNAHLIVHLGGFTRRENVAVPVMYHIWNHGDIDPRTGEYPGAQRTFKLREDVESQFKTWPNPNDYPRCVRQRLQRMIDERRYFWFNNGADFGAFNVFKDAIWQALHVVKDAGFGPKATGLGARVAFCKMAVEVFGSYFTHHYDPEDRAVGGGVDVAFIPWPEGDDAN
ncbi:MAG: hypothetical protein WBC22_17025 [Sedimentisphaerales bacterium]